ncbi:MAG: fused MFS/spermidine synthase [Armatimonadetes bacterium]|nr:fused MFS/spermidine synthase [Armatimonadota bacterium]
MGLYAVTIFLSAFLLFGVQPMLGRYILPWYGGTPAVWTTCMLFFQVCLVGGYFYSHGLISRLSARNQGRVHLAVLIVSLLLLPVTPSVSWKPVVAGDPTLRILLLLASTVGLPYLVLSTTGPLVQGWFARTYPGRSPYRLYSLSNIGSLLALITYPLVTERLLRLNPQTYVWSAGYALFAVLCGTLAVLVSRSAECAEPATESAAAPADDETRPSPVTILFWLLLSACGSWLLLATTNQLCQDVAVVPFLWVAPLSLYLISFIICFDKEQWYHRGVYGTLLAVALLLGTYLLHRGLKVNIVYQIPAYCFVMFVGCMSAHGELVRLRPGARHLTLFYLMVSVGGALSGIAIALLAPRWFSGFYEYQIGLVGGWLLFTAVLARETHLRMAAGDLPGKDGFMRVAFLSACALLGSTVGYYLYGEVRDDDADVLAQKRNFYGVLRVSEYDKGKEAAKLSLRHGRILHGFQFEAAKRRAWRTSYYSSGSGAGLALEHFPTQPKRVGVIGLGTGALAAYAEAGDSFVFYDINPDVVQITSRYFTYVQDAQARGAQVRIDQGDARITMEQQLASGQAQQFDVLLVDAFSGDAVPVHLLTRECIELYWKHLKPDGVLAIHISNRYINLRPVCRALGDSCGRQALLIRNDGDDATGVVMSDWVLLTNNRWFTADGKVRESTTACDNTDKPLVWTDDFSNLYSVLKRPR